MSPDGPPGWTAAALQPLFTWLGSPVSALEIAAFAAAVAMVWANWRVKPVAWPLAIVSSLAYGVLFQHHGLYGEAGLQLMFIALAVWGWWQWLRGTDAGRPLVVRRLPTAARWRWALATVVAWPLLGLLLQRTTDSTVPYLDALPTVASVTGQLLLARKYVENWPTWIGVNAVSIVLFAVKGLWLTVVLYALFLAMACWGWRAWHRLAGNGTATASPSPGAA